MQYCEECCKQIDTDYDAEHFTDGCPEQEEDQNIKYGNR